MAIKMIALDLDGTTLNSEGRLSEFNKETLETAIEKGIHVVVSTGRVFSAIAKDVFTIKGVKYAISSNGAVITDLEKGEVIYGDYLSEVAVKRIVELAEENNLMLEAFWGGKAYIDKNLYEDIDKNGCLYRNREYVLNSRIPLENIHASMLENIDRIENVNYFFESLDRLEEMRSDIESIPKATTTSSFPNNLEVGGPGTSKKKAVTHLAEQLGVAREELMCCGDAPNDIEMIKYAGIGVAMGNAWGGTKEYADYVTATNDEDGVAKAVIKFAL